jgi:hypothetical protein
MAAVVLHLARSSLAVIRACLSVTRRPRSCVTARPAQDQHSAVRGHGTAMGGCLLEVVPAEAVRGPAAFPAPREEAPRVLGDYPGRVIML